MKKIEKCKKYNFSGKFGCDGVWGGETYPFWLVSEEVYKSIVKDYDLEYVEREGSLYKLYMHQLFDCREEGVKQKVSIRIVSDD